jgi:hypothetical protein
MEEKSEEGVVAKELGYIVYEVGDIEGRKQTP